MSRGNLSLIGFLILALLAVHINGQDNCTAASNTYWTGYRCACKVGYKNQSNVCVPLTLLKTKGWVVREPTILPNSTDDNSTTTPIQTPNLNQNCYLPYEYFNGAGCVCLDGYSRINGLCQYSGSTNNNGSNGNNSSTNTTNITCPANSVLTSGKCVCNKGYTLVNNLCIISTSSCGANSYDNGLGFCVCNTGYYKLNNTCVSGSPCPPSSTRNSNGTCVCDAGLTKYGDYCAKCPLGAIFDTTSQKCVYVCGQNAAYDTTQLKCLCLSGYGIVAGVCTTCASGYFIQNNYCVTCPVNSVYNTVAKRCDCSNGFLLNKAGFCVSKCSVNEVFNSVTGNCDCISGLGRIGGVCSICPNNTAPSTNGSCGSCPVNQRLVDGNCICAIGYIPNQVGVCTPCTSVSGAFLINGQCATCPGDLTYDGTKCSCAAGTTRVGTSCKATCKDDELVDENGLCYKCPIYEVIADGKCSCKVNYVRNSTTGQCQLTCPSSQFSYQGRCAQCPLNLKYRSEIGGCACPDGQYLNTNGVCQQVVLTPITCDSGFYFDKTSGCVACPSGCKSCSSATVCTTCTQTGFSAVNGTCKTVCGDGVIAGTETCDDKNAINGDGCSNVCTVQTLYNCVGQPSVCTYTGPAVCGNGRLQKGEDCDDGNTINGDGCSSRCQIQTTPVNNGSNGNNSTNNTARGLSLVGNVNTNINNVFVVLKTNKTYTFANQNEMESFIKTKFPDSTAIPSVYCSQRESPELDTFDCLAIYSSGIPNQKYKIQFSFNYQGDTGFISVDVDPLASSAVTRARRSN